MREPTDSSFSSHRLTVRQMPYLMVVAILLWSTCMACSPSSHADSAETRLLPDRPADRGPVVVELFTSQGCSSCPPADRLLLELAEERGDDILPLAFHVDYWNRLGWTDPFASAAWSRRQGDYQRAFRSDHVYTPQAVIDGRSECNGADRRQISRLLADANARLPRAVLTLDRTQADAGPGAVVVSVEVVDPDLLNDGAWWLMAAVVERRAVTEVPAGENRGRKLVEGYIVRQLDKLAPIEGTALRQVWQPPDQFMNEVSGDLEVAVWLQSASTREIEVAARARLAG